MYKEIFARLSAAISAAQEERKYVLEDVFWVPISNCSSSHSVFPAIPELRAEKLGTSEASSWDTTESDSAKNLP
jgi:hypothetical protein